MLTRSISNDTLHSDRTVNGVLKRWTGKNRATDPELVAVPRSALLDQDQENDLSRQSTSSTAASASLDTRRSDDPEDFVTALPFSPEEHGIDDEMVYLEAGSYILLKKSRRGSKMVYTYLGPSGHKLRTHLAPWETPIRCLVSSHKDRLAGWGCGSRAQGENISLGIVVDVALRPLGV